MNNAAGVFVTGMAPRMCRAGRAVVVRNRRGSCSLAHDCRRRSWNPPAAFGMIHSNSSSNQQNIIRTTTAATRRCFASSSSSSPSQPSSSNNTNARPFRILGVQQIAVGSTDRQALQHLWCDLLGLTPIRTNVRMEQENVIEDSVITDNGVEIDLMTPIDPDQSPRVHSPPLHHIGLWMDDLVAGTQWLQAHGVRLTGPIRPGAAGHDICFIHPKGTAKFPNCGNGVLIELIQAPCEMLQSLPPPQSDPMVAVDPTTKV